MIATMTLTEFLLARIAEDEATSHEDWCPAEHGSDRCACYRSRVLAECTAKRHLIEVVWAYEETIDGEWGSCRSAEQMQADGIEPYALRILAAVYADHPDYREEWRP